ncbi:retron Eco8 family effector endonuclease [Serratia marcescens]|uniref:retron Eco8 family effector endonuclease n=1 Tax=Serratia marcescens TaxID=615 RepID=UPI000745404F|nr:retron Eco8 family effector endonuclease [Serratia marcescens]RNW14906.1 ATP-binding protein [Serratia nematodiphila]CUY05057.1 Predicted ATPase [Serratia marcescens]CUY42495.1 Predicted ATPase [Serratia marcescens]CUY78948.1 Predicted ATPase [Serratia marcescens]CUY84385.1 Predicted ATPase [Serratia marcescens]
MAIKSIKIKNLLSFDEIQINDINDINCIVGKNNAGKSNLLKVVRYFYNKLDGKRELPPELNNKYNSYGTISIEYDLSRIRKIVTSENQNKSSFFKHIYNVFFKGDAVGVERNLLKTKKSSSEYTLTLTINSDDSTNWSTKDQNKLKIINYLYPFFEVETRHIDLYDWDRLWVLISRLKSFNTSTLSNNDIINFFNEKISPNSDGYKNYVDTIQEITKTSKYSYREKILNYVKVGLNGHQFSIGGMVLEKQSDGTNSLQYIETFLNLLISLTRREYISPTVYIDEPEIGLHPKIAESLIQNLYNVMLSFSKKDPTKTEKGKYKTPYPRIFIATHSPHIVKNIIKLFKENHVVMHFSKYENTHTRCNTLHSTYKDKRFLNMFSDNEARLFFSDFILFVEGETEQEIFSNQKLKNHFPQLNKIDIYPGNNVLTENINPSYSNTSIPYLFLFDLDKALEFNMDEKMVFTPKLKSNGQLFCLDKIEGEINKYKFGYSAEYQITRRKLLFIDDFKNEKLKLDDISLGFKSNDNVIFIEAKKSIKEYLLEKRVYIIDDTIEGLLISKDSKELFFDWLRDVHKIDLDPVIHRAKNSRYFTTDMLIVYIRMSFNGKSESLVTRKKIKNTKKKFFKSRRILEIVNDRILGRVPKGKTDGWVTSFLDFALEKFEAHDDFHKEFNRNFPHLNDIIAKLQI